MRDPVPSSGSARSRIALWDGIERARLLPTRAELWLRSLGGGVFAALRGGLVAAITQDWLQVGVAV